MRILFSTRRDGVIVARWYAALACLMVSALSTNCDADLVAGSLSFDARADQLVRVTNGAPFGITDGTEFDLSAIGVISLEWESDSDGNGSVAITNFGASFSGFDADLGNFLLEAVGDNTAGNATFNGTLDNVVDSEGDLVSADLTLNTTFSFTFVDEGAVIYTRDLALFTGMVATDNVGEVYTSTGEIPGYLSLGLGALDPQVAVSVERSVTGISAVPEPGSVLAMLGLGGTVGLFRRRK